MIFFAFLGYLIGAGFAAVLVLNAIAVLGWAFISSPIALLPGIGQVIAAVLNWIGVGSWLALLSTLFLIVLAVLIAYLIATAGVVVPVPAPGLQATGGLERAGRGLLIGINTGLNHAFLLSVIGGTPQGQAVAGILAIVNFASAFRMVSNNVVYQTVLAYTTLFLPMALVINVVGYVFLAINSASAAFGFSFDWFAEWRRANLVSHGGVTHVIPESAYNLGNFTLLSGTISLDNPWRRTPAGFVAFTATGRGIVFHECAHMLNVGAFGWIYHLVGFADEFAPFGRGIDAHSELCAESGLRALGRDWIDTWTTSFAPPAPANSNALAAVTLTAGAGVVLVAADATTLSVACEQNRGVTLDSTGSTDPDAYPTALGNLWLLTAAPAGGGNPPAELAAGAPTLVFLPPTGGSYAIDFWITDGINGNPLPANPVDTQLFIFIDAVAAVIVVPSPLVASGPNVTITLDSSTSTVLANQTLANVGPPRRQWRVEASPNGSAALGMTAATIAFTFPIDLPGPYDVSLTVSCDVVDAATGQTVTLSDRATTTVTV
jgi:hypothetical protein